MATRVGTAYVPVEGDWSRFNRDLSTRKRSLTRTFGRLGAGAGKAFAGGIGVAAGAGLAAVAIEGKRAFEAFQESNKIAKQTGAVLKSTGGVAGVTADRVSKLATAISRKTGVDDEAIQSGENLLLTFTNVRNEAGKGNKVFNRATGVITDMSVALGQDTKSSAIQLGKALNDPVKGITALSRVGVSFTEQQKEQIKASVAAGDTLGAQRLILGELTKEFGGSAAAQATATDKMKVAVGNLEEGIGRGLAPAVDAVASKVTHLAQDIEPDLLRVTDQIARIFGREDLDLAGKIKLSSGKVQQALAPLVQEGRGAIDRMHLGDRIEKAIEDGAPLVVDALAASAPRAAGAFVRAFKNASPWGQLLTVAFLAQRLGAFSAVGKLAAERFMARYRTKAIPLAAEAGAASGAANAAAFTTASSAGMVKGKGKFRGAALAIGKFMGPLVAIPLAIEVAKEIERRFNPDGKNFQDAIDNVRDKVQSIIDIHNHPGIKAPRGGIPRDPDIAPRRGKVAREKPADHAKRRRERTREVSQGVGEALAKHDRQTRHRDADRPERDKRRTRRTVQVPRKRREPRVDPRIAIADIERKRAAAGHSQAVAVERAKLRRQQRRQASIESFGSLSKFDEEGLQLLNPAQLSRAVPKSLARPRRGGGDQPRSVVFHQTNNIVVHGGDAHTANKIRREIDRSTADILAHKVDRRGG